jgi:hypothetical protein
MPYTGVVLAFVFIHLAVFLILLGHWVAAAGMFPKATRALADVYEQRPLRATLVGLFTFGPLFFLFLQNAKIHYVPLRVFVFAATFGALLVAFIGTAGLALRIGRNLCAGGDIWQQVLRAGVMLALVFITPLLGWLFMLPVGLASGFGAMLLARPWKAAPQPAVVPSATGAMPALS